MAESVRCPLCAARDAQKQVAASSGHYLHCALCDLVYQVPAQRLASDAERAHYLTHENEVDDPRYRAFLAQLAAPLLERLPAGAEGLDYGAGPGPALAAMLAEAGHPTAIYDPYFAPARAALDRDYDFITCTEVVEHLHDPRSDFDLLARLLRPNGWLGLMTELRPELAAFPDWYYHRDPTHVCFYSEQTIHWIAARYLWSVEFVSRRVILLRAPMP
ncbi:MAG: class I SAM-dependent methyltransferase [Xanthomonadaceae bacterium]|nr:class I SAM-dependent methyltransferase [Xanthomonadaceae bacterium]